ncbi:MAG TPA: 3-isopropylmalate dehydratase small subunit [Anaerolineales bacterium]|nr:3-isopropylmalate dehydratase small subunit [Anaerolineales bacterium]
MEPFTILTSCLLPLAVNDIDTDQIIPARYLKVTDKSGLSEGLFAGWRYTPDGKPNPGFPFNQAAYQGCQILLAGDNFGCGSSREHAPWALMEWGIRAVISTSFADIFQNNALKNGLLPVAIDAETHRRLFQRAAEGSSVQVSIDLAAQKLVLPGGEVTSFPIDAFNKICLLEGVDSLGYLLKQEVYIADFERQRQLAR